MPQITVRDAITQVARNLSLVNGVNMTPYSDDTILGYLIAAHEHIMGEHEWAEMMLWRTRTLSGTNGLVTQLITDTVDWKKIVRVYHELYQTPMPVLTSYINPLFDSSLAQGYRGIPPEEDNTATAGKYLVKFYPLTLTGNVLLQIRREVSFETDTTVVPIDWWLHVYLASWMYAVDDGTNPGQIDKYLKMSDKRMKQVTARENSRPTSLTPGSIMPSQWWEDDAPYS